MLSSSDSFSIEQAKRNLKKNHTSMNPSPSIIHFPENVASNIKAMPDTLHTYGHMDLRLHVCVLEIGVHN